MIGARAGARMRCSWRLIGLRGVSKSPFVGSRCCSRLVAAPVGDMSPQTMALAKGLVEGNRVALARSITLIESMKEEHHQQAQFLLEYVLEQRRKEETSRASGERLPTFRLGIAGPPGAGKSTFIEALGTLLVQELNYKVAVLAIDPSSSRTGGSILGDKTRMETLSKLDRAYVRPSPTRGALGGVAQHTNDVILLCEAAGYEIVIVETVGLGQSEVLVDETVDMLMLLVPPAGGDELQGVKKGIMEVADMVVVNKADGALEQIAMHSSTDYMHALQLMRRKRPAWRPRVKRCSALKKEGILEVWQVVDKFRDTMSASGDIAAKRLGQNKSWMWSQFKEQLMARAKGDSRVQARAEKLVDQLSKGLGTPRHAARILLDEFFTKQNQDTTLDFTPAKK